MLFVTFDLKRMSVKSRSEQQLQDAAAAAASLPKWWRLRPLLWRRLNENITCKLTQSKVALPQHNRNKTLDRNTAAPCWLPCCVCKYYKANQQKNQRLSNVDNCQQSDFTFTCCFAINTAVREYSALILHSPPHPATTAVAGFYQKRFNFLIRVMLHVNYVTPSYNHHTTLWAFVKVPI